MARHNRFGRGQDQRGHEFVVGYQPDWLHQVKVTRELPNGRQSTKALFRNPTPAEQSPGARVRTQISAPELGLDFEVELNDPRHIVRRITIETVVPEGHEQGEVVVVALSRNRTLPAPGASSGGS
jgi:hypothetical protein